MNVIHGKGWDDKIHRWEHNVVNVSEKMIHNEAFWAVLIVTALLLTMILLAIFTENTGNTRELYPTPFGPYPYY
ncbi:MAG: hypothetical protein A2Y10_01520 [Planctomycetes bacterium GWF2_41_51]|nr:MAG: hypothetical protein A2Y10_01520 [Planctomycetes bacterium GWF2_41_51]HBG25476.1 hypothetical protein [Phycisphaerales bacterium]